MNEKTYFNPVSLLLQSYIPTTLLNLIGMHTVYMVMEFYLIMKVQKEEKHL